MIDTLAEGVLAGETRAVARAITMVERGGEDASLLVERLRSSGRAGHLIGVTGSPGAGKSSLIGQLAKEFRGRGKQVGVIAVDPSSPFSGGAVLGDRVRMQELACDPGVFVRSMASRGHPGGLAAAVDDAAAILKAAGKEIILVETVGVGQGELDVASAVQTVIVVATPGMGDEIQSLKAGILEVADIYVVNKADLPGADAVARSLQVVAHQTKGEWRRPVIQTSAATNAGIADLAEAVEKHGDYLSNRRIVGDEEIQRTCKTILTLAGRQMLDELEAAVKPERLALLAEDVVAGTLEPREAAREAIRLLFAAHRAAPRLQKLEIATSAKRDCRVN
ncbi:MAG: methylmalonyl Co-A mutase-associated GTPase MeaB [Sphingomonadaceae bacterium]